MKNLTVRDIATLMQTCKYLKEHLNQPQIWISLHRVHFGKSPIEIYKQSYNNEHVCGRETFLGDEWFTCTNAPVYINTLCIKCMKKRKICSYCARRERIDRIFCGECKLFYRICDECELLHPNANIMELMRACGNCGVNKCDLHYINNYVICTDCLVVFPDLIDVVEALAESQEVPQYQDGDMYELVIEVPIDEEISGSEDNSDTEIIDLV